MSLKNLNYTALNTAKFFYENSLIFNINFYVHPQESSVHYLFIYELQKPINFFLLNYRWYKGDLELRSRVFLRSLCAYVMR